MSKALRVLIVEDSVDDTFFIVRELQRAGFTVSFERVETYSAMEAALDAQSWDLIISDYSLPQFGGAAALGAFLQRELDIPFIMVSGAMGEDRAVEMVKAGAHDYVMKDNLSRLVPAIERELKAARERSARRQSDSATALLAAIVQSCDDAIIGMDLEGMVLSWNQAAERLFGYAALEMLGQSADVLFPHHLVHELPEMLEKLQQGERINRFETVRVRKDGTPVEVSLTISPIRDAAGRLIGASTVARDISERKQEESRRLARIQQLTAALEHADA